MYDLIIIGSGPGGYEAIMTALRMRLKIAVVEKGKLGGNCLNRACIPTKYYRAGAHFLEKSSKAENYGIDLSINNISFTKAKEGKDKAIGFLRKSFAQLLKAKKVPVYKGKGVVIDKHKVRIEKEDGTKEVIQGNYILIATGSVPSSVGDIVPDRKYILTTEDFMENLQELPESLLVIGGGVAGCEISYISALYGAKTTIVEIKNRLLPIPTVPDEVSKLLQRKFRKQGINFKLGVYVKEYQFEDGQVRFTLSDGTDISVEKALLSVGRKPNTADIDTIGLEKDEKGFLKVNEYLQTSIENIYACGDVVNSPMLAHVASYEARVAIKNMFSDKKEEVDYSVLPWAIFTAFEIAHVGLSENEARKKGFETVSGYYPFMYNEKAVDELETDGFVRLVFDKKTGQILGGTIVGIEASELIHVVAYALKNQMTATQIHEFIYFHPSLSEIFLFATYDVAVGKLF